MSKQMTAVSWLIETIKYIDDNFEEMLNENPEFSKDYYINKAYEQAKEIDKQQYLEFGSSVAERWGICSVEPHFIEDEYNKYFKTNEQ